jgi:phage-related protein (TIGR01555 family)
MKRWRAKARAGSAGPVRRGAARLRAATDSQITNPYSGVGTTRDRSTATTVAAPPILDQVTLDDLFAGSKLVRRIVSKRAAVALSRGVRWQLVEGDAEALRAQVRRTALLPQVEAAATWGRLYGGALLVALVADGLPLDQPLTPGAPVLGFQVVDRYDVSMVRWVDGYADPARAGQVGAYLVRLSYHGTLTWVDASRVWRFGGDPVPRRKSREQQGWDNSVLVGCYGALVRLFTAASDLSAQLSDANVGVWKIDGFNEWIEAEDEASLQTWLDTQLLYRGVLGDVAIDAKDSFEYKARPIRDGVDVLTSLMHLLASEVDLPFTELYGMSPAGLNATGDSDISKWHETIDSYERPALARCLEWAAGLLLAQPEVGGGEGAVVEWPALRQMSARDQEELEGLRIGNESKLIEMGALKVEAVKARLRASGRYELQDEEEEGAPGGEGLGALEKARQGRLLAQSGALHLHEDVANLFRGLLGMEPWQPSDREEFLALQAQVGGGAGGGEVAADGAPQVGAACDGETGDGTSLALVFRLPAVLGEQRPSLAPFDDSAPHVTFLHMPSVRDAAVARAVIAPLLAAHPRPHRATLRGLEHLLSPAALVAYQGVRFEAHWRLEELRERLVEALRAVGVAVSFGDRWEPHLTLAYLQDHTAPYAGPVLQGSWHAGALELWGGPQIEIFPLGVVS